MEEETQKTPGDESMNPGQPTAQGGGQANQQSSSYLIPASIMFAGILVAAAIMYSGTSQGTAPNPQPANIAAADPSELAEKVQPVTGDDRILGDPAAPVKLIEFSDLECPFCKRFHETVGQVMNEYGKSGKVAVVYRHFPLDQLHSKARNEAEAAECARELGGNKAFWEFIGRVFEITPSNDGLDPARLPQIAQTIGLNAEAFSSCVSSGRHAAVVQAQYEDAVNAGGTGTPFSIIIAPNGKKFPINGALPYANIKSVIEKALSET